MATTHKPRPSITISAGTNDSLSDLYTFDANARERRYSSRAPSIPTILEVIPIPKETNCYCRFLWNNELHGLTAYLKSPTWPIKIFWGLVILTCIAIASWMTYDVIQGYFEHTTATRITIKREKSLMYPTVVMCPKNADALNMTAVRADIALKLPPLHNHTITRLIGFAVAGAGFGNFDDFIANLTESEQQRLGIYFERWKGHLSLADFYVKLFEQFGYNCNDVCLKS
uniref:SLC3A2_N domain-containing protein n=1 Tax=Panagrellus redivivus TaxID=6233 RepID=A0A7E4VQI8_PANRE